MLNTTGKLYRVTVDLLGSCLAVVRSNIDITTPGEYTEEGLTILVTKDGLVHKDFIRCGCIKDEVVFEGYLCNDTDNVQRIYNLSYEIVPGAAKHSNK